MGSFVKIFPIRTRFSIRPNVLPQSFNPMNSRIRIKLFTIISLSLISLLTTASLAQQRGGGGGGPRGPQDPTAPYIRQMKLEGKDAAAFKKAFNANTRRVEKWASKVRTFQNKNKKYIGKSDVDPAIIEKIKADKAELDAQKAANGEAFKKDLSAFLSPEQITQVGAIGKRVAEQRAKARERRAAGGQGGGRPQGGGGGRGGR